ncbi:MAG TPA: PD-(D/E)XK nuclease family protein [Polyangiaceae bacterium]
MMRVLAGLEFGGATLTAFDDLALGRANIGHAVWNPNQLLRDLELRLGLGAERESEAVRVAKWVARIAELPPRDRFYSKSFETDALGTGRVLLRLRDSLVEAGWDGQAIPDGGFRLETIAELEGVRVPVLPFGYADRLAMIARSLVTSHVRFYAELILAEPAELWSSRWRVIFQELERAGTRLSHHDPNFPGAPPASDLGRVQAALNGDSPTGPVPLRGDGSFVLLTAETAWEAARSTAAILAELPADRTVVVREGDVSALDNALSVHGSRSQGWRSTSPWRAALQVLPLALELAFEPKDPQRVLELLTLPVGPFRGSAGRRLAEALTQSPGIGSPAWTEAKARLVVNTELLVQQEGKSTHPEHFSERSEQLLERIAQWLEQRGDDAVSGSAKMALLAVIARVRTWLISRLPSAPDDVTLLTAVRHAGALGAALESDPRSTFSLVEVRRLAESVLETGTAIQLIEERAGRVAHVDSAGSLGVARANVVWWSFTDAGTSSVALPWRRREFAALSSAGIHFPDPRARLVQRAVGWRRAVLAATERVILVALGHSAGETLALHPLWDEIVARTRADAPTRARVTLRAHELRDPASVAALLKRPPLHMVEAALLPGGRPEWAVPAEDVAPIDHFSAASLNALLGCPLQWGLQYRAGVNSGGHALPPLFMLNGTLGHRLVELLHGQGAFDLPDDELESRAEVELDQLFEREGAILLRAGMAFERHQLRTQLVDSVLELSRSLRGAGLRILAVEKPIDVPWRGGKLVGRIDLLVATSAGTQAIVDVKWGLSSYRELLRSGHALQLAAYAFAHALERGEQTIPEATYFSLKQRKLFGLTSDLLPNAETIDGPSLAETWKRVERSVDDAERLAVSGRFAVTGVRKSLPLLTALGIPDGAHADHFALKRDISCKYCGFDAICGRRWEGSL